MGADFTEFMGTGEFNLFNIYLARRIYELLPSSLISLAVTFDRMDIVTKIENIDEGKLIPYDALAIEIKWVGLFPSSMDKIKRFMRINGEKKKIRVGEIKQCWYLYRKEMIDCFNDLKGEMKSPMVDASTFYPQIPAIDLSQIANELVHVPQE